VPGNEELQFQLMKENADEAMENARRISLRAEKLERLGAFRVLEKQKSNFARRVFRPKWSQTIHMVKAVVGPMVIDTTNERYPTKRSAARVKRQHRNQG
jgi:hypothetical protein